MNRKNQQEARRMEGWFTERGCRGSRAGAWGTGISSYHNLTMDDDNLPAKFHLYPFSRFAGIHVSVQFGAKTYRVCHFGGKFREERVNCRQLRLVLWVGSRRMGLSYERDRR